MGSHTASWNIFQRTLTADASCETSHHALLAECFETKQRIWFNPVRPIFFPCVLDCRFPLKANMIFLLWQKSVLQREVCCLFTSSHGKSETVWPRCSSTPGAAVVSASLTQEMKQAQHKVALMRCGGDRVLLPLCSVSPEDAGRRLIS